MIEALVVAGWLTIASALVGADVFGSTLGPASRRQASASRGSGLRNRVWVAFAARRSVGGSAKDLVRYRRELGLLAAAVATGVRSGQTIHDSIGTARSTMDQKWCERLRREMNSVDIRISRGDGLTDALAGWTRESSCPEVELLCAAIRLGSDTGGRLADALDGVAATITIRNELHAEQRALSSQARMTARVLVAAPAGFAVLAGLIDARVSTMLFTTPLGWIVMAVAAVLDLVGWRWMERIVARLEARS